MNLIKLIINWFKKDHAAASAKALSAFNDVKTQLQQLNSSAAKKAAANLVKSAQLESEAKALSDVMAKNNNVIANIEKLIGVE